MSKTPITIEALEKEGFTIREVPGMEFSTVYTSKVLVEEMRSDEPPESIICPRLYVFFQFRDGNLHQHGLCVDEYPVEFQLNATFKGERARITRFVPEVVYLFNDTWEPTIENVKLFIEQFKSLKSSAT